jgi:hypothetical protein
MAQPDAADQSVRQFFVKARGLPYRATEEEVKEFFGPGNLFSCVYIELIFLIRRTLMHRMIAKISAGCMEHIIKVDFLIQADGRPSGMAYVTIEGNEPWGMAMEKDGKMMGKRYVEREYCWS